MLLLFFRISSMSFRFNYDDRIVSVKINFTFIYVGYKVFMNITKSKDLFNYIVLTIPTFIDLFFINFDIHIFEQR